MIFCLFYVSFMIFVSINQGYVSQKHRLPTLKSIANDRTCDRNWLLEKHLTYCHLALCLKLRELVISSVFFLLVCDDPS